MDVREPDDVMRFEGLLKNGGKLSVADRAKFIERAQRKIIAQLNQQLSDMVVIPGDIIEFTYSVRVVE